MAYEFMTSSPEQLAGRLATCEPGSTTHTQIMSEIQRRQLFAQYQATEVLERAAHAEQLAAQATEIAAKAAVQNTKYMMWAAVAASISAAMSLGSTICVLWFRW